MSTLAELKARANAAKKAYQDEYRRLYRGDMTVFPKEEHEERLRTIQARRNATLAAVEAEARELFQTAREEAALALERAPDFALTAPERSEVNERLPMIEADVDTLSGDALARRIRGIVSHGSKTEKFAYYMALRKRVRADARREADGSGGPGISPYKGASTNGLDLVLLDIERAAVGEQLDQVRKQADDRLSEIGELVDRSYLARHDAKDAFEVHAKRFYHDISHLPPADGSGPGLGRSCDIAADRAPQGAA